VVRALTVWFKVGSGALIFWCRLRAGGSRYSGATFDLLPKFSAPSGGNPGPREEARRKRSLATSPASKVRLSAGGRASRGTPGWRSLAFHSSVNLAGSDAWRVSVCGVRGRSKDGAGDEGVGPWPASAPAG